MTPKDILVHLDSTARSEMRLDLAISLARRYGARLRGLFAQVERSGPSIVARMPSDRLSAAAADTETLFRGKLDGTGVAGDWRALEHGEVNYLIRETIIWSRYADLVVLGQHDPHLPSPMPEELPEQVILNSGRPVLTVPYAGTFADVGERIAVAWNAEREAARALGDAVFLLRDAKEVVMLSLHSKFRPLQEPEIARPDVFDHLACHGIRAQGDNLLVGDSSAMEVLLSRIADLGVDLLVMGAHGHYGFPYINRGGATRHILRHMTVPVLMSH